MPKILTILLIHYESQCFLDFFFKPFFRPFRTFICLVQVLMITNLAFPKKVMIYAQNANYFIIDRLGVKPRGFTPAYKRAENRAENRLRDNFRRPISLGQTLPADYESGPPEESYDLSSKYRVFTWILL